MAKRKVNSEKVKYLQEQLDKTSPVWWRIVLSMLEGESKEDRRFAMNELNKLQTKMIPNEVSGLDGGPIVFKWAKK